MVPHVPPILNRLATILGWRPPAAPEPPAPEPSAPDPLAADRPLPLAHPDLPLPPFVAACPVAQKYRALPGDLDWAHFPERPTDRPYPGPTPAPRAPFVAAFLVKLHEQKTTMRALRTYLHEHPALVWLLGFPLEVDPDAAYGFDVDASLPSRRQLSRVLRDLSNPALQFLLSSSVERIRAQLPPELAATFGDVIAIDTKHILAWVKENNPKQYVEERFDPKRQPKGDPDCKLGVKTRRNTSPDTTSSAAPPTPTSEGVGPSQKRGDPVYYCFQL